MTSSNPIYQHLTRHRRWPSVIATILISVSLSALVTSIIVLQWQTAMRTLAIPSLDLLWLVVILSILACVFSPAFSVLVTTLHATALTNDQAFQLLKLTVIKPPVIVQGHLWAAIFWLRVQWGICFGLLPILFAACICLLGFESLDTDLTTSEIFRSVSPRALAIVLTGAVLGLSFNWLSICTAIWGAVYNRNRSNAVVIALAVIFVQIIMLPAAVWGVVISTFLLNECGLVGSLVCIPAVSISIGRRILEEAEQFV